MNGKLGCAMERQELYEYMRRQRYGVLSSVSTDGTPQSALVGVAITPELDIVFDTLKTSRKYPNLLQDPRCSFVLGWHGEQTVQLEGVAEQPIGDELLRLQAIYFETWPDGAARAHWTGIVWLVMRTRWLRYSDYNFDPPRVWESKIGDQL
jgi:pyridoxine/pyridoxamine 5'-phosphate oxidase